ncbi:uncharacterized protein [Temnothorax nylanderi]|uniref:uncharacterized protein n=1 Tax=Temnothorax nylanderi TaxID=102681 RepID=UPI003A8BF116
MSPLLKRFYEDCLVPEIIDSRAARNMPIREPQYVIEAQAARKNERIKVESVIESTTTFAIPEMEQDDDCIITDYSKRDLNEDDIKRQKKYFIDSKTILQIWISLALLAPKSTKVSTKTDGRRRMWKPTISESRDGILVHCKIFGDIEQMCINKQNKMSQINLTMQPFVIVVGPEVTTIEKVYLRIDKIMYEMPSVLKAIDVLFKIFITFNACYPKECENFWYLIQWDVYEIRTASDQKIPFVCSILHDLKQG